MFSVQKQQFYVQFEFFLSKLSIIMVSRHSGEHLRTHCVKKISLRPLNIKITRN